MMKIFLFFRFFSLFCYYFFFFCILRNFKNLMRFKFKVKFCFLRNAESLNSLFSRRYFRTLFIFEHMYYIENIMKIIMNS